MMKMAVVLFKLGESTDRLCHHRNGLNCAKGYLNVGLVLDRLPKRNSATRVASFCGKSVTDSPYDS
jgi:hypothetical protein